LFSNGPISEVHSDVRCDLQGKIRTHDPDAEVEAEAEADVKEPGAEVTIPHEEYQALKRKAREVEELASKRVAMAMAQVPVSLP